MKKQDALKRKWLLLFIPVSLFMLLLARIFPFFAEQIYARHIYKWLSQTLNWVTGLFPFSLGELLLVLSPFLFLYWLIKWLIHIIKDSACRRAVVTKGLLTICCFFSVLLFSFTLLCGMNYYRYNFTYYSGLVIEESTAKELQELCMELVHNAALARESITSFDEAGVVSLYQDDFRKTAEQAAAGFRELGKQYAVLAGNYAAPKPVFFSRFMSRMEISGIYFPFTVEANVNVDCTKYTIPVTMCHELAHLRGFMREDEANYIAYLACKASELPELQYSGYMLALVYAANQLYQVDKERYYEVKELYSDGMQMDLNADWEYWSQFENTVISTISNAVNDTYLKANNQTDGTRSYGRMLDLLLAEYKHGRNTNETSGSISQGE